MGSQLSESLVAKVQYGGPDAGVQGPGFSLVTSLHPPPLVSQPQPGTGGNTGESLA